MEKFFTVIDKTNNALYKTQVLASTPGEAIKYFFKLEKIKERPVMPRYQEDIKSPFDARYAVVSSGSSSKVIYYNIDGEAYNKETDTTYKVKKR